MAFVFARILSLSLMSFYENLTTLFLMSQHFGLFVIIRSIQGVFFHNLKTSKQVLSLIRFLQSEI